MDLMRLLRSLEELLYELTSWMVFFPRTLWLTLTQPTRMMDYGALEATDDGKKVDPYRATITPPLFLLLALLAAHGVELLLVPASLLLGGARYTQPGLDSRQNILLFRGVAFSLFPLLLAVRTLRRRGIDIDRDTLKPPFYAQCFVAAPFAFVVSSAAAVQRMEGYAWTDAAWAVLTIGAFVWLLVVETRWFRRHLELSTARAALTAGIAIVQATILALLMVVILTMTSGAAQS